MVSSPKRPAVLVPIHATNLMATADAFPGRRERAGKVYRDPPSSAEAKNEWSYTSTPPHAFTECTGRNVTLIFPTERSLIKTVPPDCPKSVLNIHYSCCFYLNQQTSQAVSLLMAIGSNGRLKKTA